MREGRSLSRRGTPPEAGEVHRAGRLGTHAAHTNRPAQQPSTGHGTVVGHNYEIMKLSGTRY